MSRLVVCDFPECKKATPNVIEAGFYRVFTPECITDEEGDVENVILDFCSVAHLAGWALKKEAGL